LPEAQAVIIGSLTSEPDYVAQVQAAIRDLGLEGAVHLRGHVPEADLRAAYAQADVFALPSLNQGWKFEGYGIVYLEAGAAGLPVIGTRDCGAEDAIEDGVTGLLIPQTGIAESLPAALLRLLNDADLRARMGAAGLAKATRQSWDWVAAQWVAAYRAGREG
jgi:glycosyltransferase involved in cell wall biosynthesis